MYWGYWKKGCKGVITKVTTPLAFLSVFVSGVIIGRKFLC